MSNLARAAAAPAEPAAEAEPAVEPRAVLATPAELTAATADHLGEKYRETEWDVERHTIEGYEGYGVHVHMNAAENLSNNLIREGIELDLGEVFGLIYGSDVEVRVASVQAYRPVRDSYGNREDGVVYRAWLDAETAELVNWDEPALVDWEQATDAFVHSTLSGDR